MTTVADHEVAGSSSAAFAFQIEESPGQIKTCRLRKVRLLPITTTIVHRVGVVFVRQKVPDMKGPSRSGISMKTSKLPINLSGSYGETARQLVIFTY